MLRVHGRDEIRLPVSYVDNYMGKEHLENTDVDGRKHLNDS
jgi:hypothetical protein